MSDSGIPKRRRVRKNPDFYELLPELIKKNFHFSRHAVELERFCKKEEERSALRKVQQEIAHRKFKQEMKETRKLIYRYRKLYKLKPYRLRKLEEPPVELERKQSKTSKC